jgi:TonB family protein
MYMRILIRITALVASLWSATRAQADAPTDLESLLALKPSPGVEALLLAYAGDPRVAQRWMAALGDPDPNRRTAVARAIGIANGRAALPALSAAFAVERDVLVRDEIARALAIVGTDTSDRPVLARLDDLSQGAATSVVTTLATTRPGVLVSWLSAGGRLGAEHNRASDLAVAIQARLIDTSPALAGALEAAADTLAPGTVQGLLHLAHSTARRVPTALIIAGLERDAWTAGESLALLPVVYGGPLAVRAEGALVEAYRRMRASLSTGRDATHDLLLGLADRWILEPEAAMPAVTSADPEQLRSLQLPYAVYAVVSEQERRALAVHMRYEGQAVTDLVRAAISTPAQPSAWEASSHRMLAEIPAAMVIDLQRLTGCKSRDRVADQPAVIQYRPDGRPQSSELDVSTMSAACARLARVLVSTAYGPMPPPAESRVFTVLRLQESWWACLADHQASRRIDDVAPRPLGGPVTPPEVVERVKAVYPPGARQRREEGNVLLEILISATGCVSEARVIRSVPSLDLAALQSVSYWRFRPARREGRPLAVTATIEVGFSLREP